MKIALVQMNIQLADAEANRITAERLIREAAEGGADTLVLPETWNLGFFPKERLAELAETPAGESKKLLAELAKEYGVNIVGGSLVTRRGNRVYNRALVIGRDGKEIASYDKIHLFSPSGEQDYFTAGSQICTFELDGISAGLITCYDLRFAELVRSLALRGIKILFVPAAWPHPRLSHWQILNRARAIENQVYVACVNGCGVADELDFCGHSMVIDPLGEILAEAEEDEGIFAAEVDFTSMDEIRANINVFRDRRPGVYDLSYDFTKKNPGRKIRKSSKD